MKQRREEPHASHRLRSARDWQPRQEFDQLCQWWRTGAFGICVLDGMAGSGKTALIDRFLRILPGGYPQLPDVAKEALPEANGTFVFSFFDGSEVTFLGDLANWLTNLALDTRPSSYGFPSEDPGYRVPSPSTASYRQLLNWLSAAAVRHGKLLLVLDGMDRVQDASSDPASVGRILDIPLQNLVVDAAEGLLGIAVLITTRYPLTDVVAARAPYVHRIEVAGLRPQACCDLLKARGVRATDERLAELSQQHGFHAFSLDLLGGFIAEYCGGDPDQLHHAPSGASEEKPLQSVIARYRESLATKDKAAFAILERLCLFRMGATADLLARLFLRKNPLDSSKKELSGATLAKLSADALTVRLGALAKMRLVLESQGPAGVRYSVHPALRDTQLSGMAPSQQVLIHKAVLKDAGIQLDGGGLKAAALDDLEGLIYHALGAGLRALSWDLFRDVLAARDWSPSGYHREERACRAIAAGKPDTWLIPTRDLLAELPSGLTFAWATTLERLGRLESAAFCFDFLSVGTNDPCVFTRLYDVWLQLGYIQLVRRSLEAWVSEIMRTVEYGEYDFIIPLATQLDELAKLRGYARVLSGVWEVRDWRGSELLSAYVGVPTYVAQRPVTGTPGMHFVQLFLRLGKIDEAVEAVRTQEEYARREHEETDRTAAFWMRFRLLRAEIALEQGNVTEALDLQQQGYAWAAARDANEMLCFAHLLRARIELTGSPARKSLAATADAADQGLRLARSCGYALYHIDLLIVRAQASLSAGRHDDAEQDLVLALHGNQSWLGAANKSCGYAWGLVMASHWLGVTYLVQAARLLQRTEFDPARTADLPEPVRTKLDKGAAFLKSAAETWKQLAASASGSVDLGGITRAVRDDLDRGRLPVYPLGETAEDKVQDAIRTPSRPEVDVFLSYNSEDRELVSEIADALKQRGVSVWFDHREVRPGALFESELDQIIRTVGAAAVFIGASGIGPWQVEEISACLRQSVYRGQAVIPVLLPNATAEPKMPVFLEHRSRVDLRTETGLDRLLWAIQGARPRSLPASV